MKTKIGKPIYWKTDDIPQYILLLKKVKALTAKEFAALYNVSIKTFLKWIERYQDDIGEKIGRHYTIPQVRIIIWRLGVPNELQND